MRRLSSGGILIILLCSLTLHASAANSDPKVESGREDLSLSTFSEPLTAAQESLKLLAKIHFTVDSDTELFARTLGFASADEVTSAQIGSPLHLFEVPTEQLEAFQEGNVPDTLLVDTHLVIFPLLAHGQARSTLFVAELKPEKGWRVVSKGRPKLVRLIERYRKSDTNFLVAISNLGVQLLGDGSGKQMMLTPLQDIVTLNTQAGQPMPAHKLFTLLSRDLKALREESGKQLQEAPK